MFSLYDSGRIYRFSYCLFSEPSIPVVWGIYWVFVSLSTMFSPYDSKRTYIEIFLLFIPWKVTKYPCCMRDKLRICIPIRALPTMFPLYDSKNLYTWIQICALIVRNIYSDSLYSVKRNQASLLYEEYIEWLYPYPQCFHLMIRFLGGDLRTPVFAPLTYCPRGGERAGGGSYLLGICPSGNR